MRRARASRKRNSKRWSTSRELPRFHPPNWPPIITTLSVRMSEICCFRENAAIVATQVAAEQWKQVAESKKTEALNAMLKN